MPLWFATWKNAISSYAPAWVKTDLERFFRAQVTQGMSSLTISPMCTAACEADARAFAALMRHLREVDGKRQTVIMVQVENETGLLGAARDVCPQADEAYAEQVPRELMAHLEARRGALNPELSALWRQAGGSWEEVFGQGGPEVFMAWHTARYVNAVAGAGKAEYPLPMYANAWLMHQKGQSPGAYPSGGPVAKMMDIWQAAALAMDALADTYYLVLGAGFTITWHPLPGGPQQVQQEGCHRDGAWRPGRRLNGDEGHTSSLRLSDKLTAYRVKLFSFG